MNNVHGVISVKGTLLVAFVMLVLYAITSIGTGMIDVLDGAFFESNGSFNGNGSAIEGLFVGFVNVISGIMTVFAAMFCHRRINRLVATYLTAGAGLLLLLTLVFYDGIADIIFQVIVGCIVAYLVYSSKEQFTDEN